MVAGTCTTWWSSPKVISKRGSPSCRNSGRSMSIWKDHRPEIGECPFILWSYLALGGMLALVPDSRLRYLSRVLAGPMAWAGLGAIAFSTVRFNDDTLFPVYAALLPTLGTAAVIAAGFATASGKTPAGAARLLTLGPVRHVGRLSYSWYLWHWPPLVFAGTLWGNLSPLEGTAALAVSYFPSLLTTRLIEKPFLYSQM